MKVMNMIQLKASVESKALLALGYKLDIYKNGYVSKCGSTIIYLYRKPYNGEVRSLTKSDLGLSLHKANLQALIEEGMIVTD